LNTKSKIMLLSNKRSGYTIGPRGSAAKKNTSQ
jgi:hypothetical protein